MRQLPGNLINGLFPLLPFPRTCCLEWTALSTILDFEPSYFGDQKREKRSKRTKKTAKFMGLVEPPFTHGLLVFFFFLLINLFLAVLGFFVSVRGLSLVAESRGHSSSRCAGLSLSRPLLLQSTGSRRAGSVVVAHGPSCSAACGIFPDLGSNPCPLHWQADSQPLHHQGSPVYLYFDFFFVTHK